ncbi:alpha/beta fold hydrolase [Streptomyces chiangmaiensis]|uniref:Alpha/beta hydrolase n=1 Tax=Streptomyces chiangmaiensis TaxID=766497 RepID=A0ABU7FHI0_9ACTN|nr:alpha/beta hydrolase [Streptomyces chiangmaiensis]MED7823384.1 alpha/beta hydrolase [Streptomyces chiangmaiensis]
MGTERATSVVRLDEGPVEYRLERRGPATVVVLHGGHTRAGLAVGEEMFAEAGYTVLAPSRPGYGRTPLSTGTASGFADVVPALCAHLGITEIAAVVGTSGGGTTAVTMAARHPDLVRPLILQSAVGWLAWPDRRTRLGAHIAFAARTEGATWGAVRVLLRHAPETGLRLLLQGLTTLPARRVTARLGPEERAAMVELFCRMRSGHGFLNDLRPTPDLTAEVRQPTLVIATRTDGGVPFAHAQSLAAAIPHAELVESRADSHLVWFGADWPEIATRVCAFLADSPSGGTS